MAEAHRTEIQINENSPPDNSGQNIIRPFEVESSPSPRSWTSSVTAVNQNQTPSPFRELTHFKKRISWLIPCIVTADILLFIITMYFNDCPKNSVSCYATFLGRLSFQPFKENPLLGPSSSALEKMGALDVSRVVDDHQVWRLISCIWLHGGLFHLLANMLSLLVIGIRLEQEFGFIRIGLLYLISGLGGSLLSALFLQSNISVGASGAVFGLLGGMLSELITNWTVYANKMAALFTLFIIIVINLAVGILPHVDNFAHLGGFSSGFLLGFVLLMRPQFGWVSQNDSRVRAGGKPKYKTYQLALWLLSLILVVEGMVAGFVSLRLRVDLNDYCSWCYYMSCVPTSRWSCDTSPVSCMSEQIGNRYTLTCFDNGKNGTYILNDPNSSQIRRLCIQLCR